MKQKRFKRQLTRQYIFLKKQKFVTGDDLLKTTQLQDRLQILEKDINYIDSNNNTWLHIMFKNEIYCLASVKFLISKGINLNHQNNNMKSSLHILADKYSLLKIEDKIIADIINALIDNGADVFSKDFYNFKAGHHFLCNNIGTNIMEKIIKHAKIPIFNLKTINAHPTVKLECSLQATKLSEKILYEYSKLSNTKKRCIGATKILNHLEMGSSLTKNLTKDCLINNLTKHSIFTLLLCINCLPVKNDEYTLPKIPSCIWNQIFNITNGALLQLEFEKLALSM